MIRDDNVKHGGPILPSYAQLLKHFRKEVWVIPILAAAGLIILILIIFEIYLLSKTINKNPSRRHLFLGQMLLLGLLSCAAMSTLVTLQPTPISCAAIRLGKNMKNLILFGSIASIELGHESQKWTNAMQWSNLVYFKA